MKNQTRTQSPAFRATVLVTHFLFFDFPGVSPESWVALAQAVADNPGAEDAVRAIIQKLIEQGRRASP